MNQFEKEAIDAHNRYRASHHAVPLTWNANLAREAQTWAERLAREDRLKHASTEDGENIYMSFGDIDVTGDVAANKWYDEVKEYNFSRPGFQSNTGHFTQIVWRGSKELGVGRAQGYDGKVFVVARYRPPGNNLRTFEENVLPAQKHYPTRSSGGWDHPELNCDNTLNHLKKNTSQPDYKDILINNQSWNDPDRWDPICSGKKDVPNGGREIKRDIPREGRERNRNYPNRGREGNRDIPNRGTEGKNPYGYQEPKQNSWEPKQNGTRQYPPTTNSSRDMGQDKFVDHKWDSGKWFDEDLIEPSVNTAQHSSPERKILQDSSNVKDGKKKKKSITERWQPEGNENQDNKTGPWQGRMKSHSFGGSVDRNKSANKVRMSKEKWKSIGNNGETDNQDGVNVGRNRTRNSIKRWEEQNFNKPNLPFQHPRPSLTKPTQSTPKPIKQTHNPQQPYKPQQTQRPVQQNQRPIQQTTQRPIQQTQSNLVNAERWDPLWGDKPLNDNRPRPKSWDSSRFGQDKLDNHPYRPCNEPKERKITTTIGDGPRKTVVSSITIILKGNEGNKVWSKSTDDLRRLDRPKSSYTRAHRQPVQEVYAEERAGRTNTRPKSEDFSSRAFDAWEPKRPVEEAQIVPETKKRNDIYDTTDSYHGNRDAQPRSQFPSLNHFSQQALDCHNVYRALHSASNLMWSPEIAAAAQIWAEKLARDRTLKHSTRERGADGENLAMFSGSFENSAKQAVDMWYDEVSNYDFSCPGYQPRSGHFTQMVWKGSKEFGMGRAQTSDGQLTIVVARYRPAGNVIRNYELNVYPKHSFF